MVDKARTVYGLLTFMLFITVFCSSTQVARAQEDIILTSYNGFPITSEFYVVLGEVQNVGSKPIKNVILDIEFQLNSSEGTFSDTDTIALPVILEGRRSPFIYWINNASLAAQIRSFQVSIKSYEIEVETVPARLNITSYAYIPVQNSILVFLVNEGDSQVFSASVYATYYDSSQEVIGVHSEATFYLNSSEGEFFNITYPFTENLEEVKWYSLTAVSINPTYVTKEDVVFAPFSVNGENGENGGFQSVVTVFIILIVFSFVVLVGAYAVAKIKKRTRLRNKRRRKHTQKSNQSAVGDLARDSQNRTVSIKALDMKVVCKFRTKV
ncbi:MAG: hypothetical protein JSV05_07345 [Candidatus Bathyarchaeota archaeon]|nr:MAG: hypothetical protein JSV05_07345 [Candidatus Bathyarchaeota archaeon]